MGVAVLKELVSVPAGIQALEAVGTVTTEDYDRVLAPLVDRARRTKGRMRLLYQFGPGFERITPGALWADSRLGVGYLPVLDGCAVVSDIDWIRAPARAIGAWMPCPMRLYGNDECDDALAWLASLPGGTDVSKRDLAKAFIGGTLAAMGSLGGLVISAGTKSSHGSR
ncbi:STAS/SEC14 domain-containing protein [Mycobacterium sp. 852002-10029_SCH5224772]|uniref:STAS/SEC14 domain-containing protein n=1 Tax=Mycobacterium sp. 852002-10029_SCH5224772 TaxID=1834083 RepID=UPI000A9F57FD|nr:STAS/SEC14 domain-containing protein [Mycobacterium sp. 852002-10029_SCH5224772]